MGKGAYNSSPWESEAEGHCFPGQPVSETQSSVLRKTKLQRSFLAHPCNSGTCKAESRGLLLLDKNLEMKGRQTSPETERICNQRGLQSLREVRLCMWSKWGGGGDLGSCTTGSWEFGGWEIPSAGQFP